MDLAAMVRDEVNDQQNDADELDICQIDIYPAIGSIIMGS